MLIHDEKAIAVERGHLGHDERIGEQGTGSGAFGLGGRGWSTALIAIPRCTRVQHLSPKRKNRLLLRTSTSHCAPATLVKAIIGGHTQHFKFDLDRNQETENGTRRAARRMAISRPTSLMERYRSTADGGRQKT